MEAIKLITKIGQPPLGKLIHHQSLNSSFREIKIKKDPNCPLCGKQPTITSLKNSQPTNQSMDSIPEISTLELRQILGSNFDGILLDVREEEEYQQVNIPQAQLLPLSQWPEAAANLPKDTEYLVHCAAGIRSARAVHWMLQNGFSNATNIAGGMKQWLQEEADS